MRTIAIDAMGGDNAPDEIVKGTIAGAKKHRNYKFLLVGDKEIVNNLLVMNNSKCENIEVLHATEVITANDEPVKALKKKKDSSMVVAAKMVKENLAQAMITAGNTGAFMAAGLLVIGRIKNVARPALAPIFPTGFGVGTMVLDVGANTEVKPEYMLQHAIIASSYMRTMYNIDNPRVGLINIGTEKGKGSELYKDSYVLLENADLNFIGNVEARDIMNNVADILVCDGFTGNILLKTAEGMAATIFSTLKSEIKSSIFAQFGSLFMMKAFRKVKTRLDYRQIGGAPLLGLNGACIKSHGSSDSLAIENAIKQAVTFINNDTLQQMNADLNNDIKE